MRSHSVAVVTGAAQGIGRRIAEVLAEKGFALALLDRQPVTELDVALSSAADVRDEAEVGGFARQVLDQLGRVDVLVNNAGIACIQPLEETTLAQWRDVIDVNLTGPFLLCREFGRAMLASGQGTIVNIASIAGLVGVADRAAYNASKHGLVGLTRTLATEWGGRGVRVNAVCPGWVKTEMDDASHGTLCNTGRHRPGRRVPGRSPTQRLHQWRDPVCRRRLVRGRLLAVAPPGGT